MANSLSVKERSYSDIPRITTQASEGYAFMRTVTMKGSVEETLASLTLAEFANVGAIEVLSGYLNLYAKKATP